MQKYRAFLTEKYESHFSLADYYQELSRADAVRLHPPAGFIVDQGCLAISRNTLITGGLSPCVAIVIRQKSKGLHLLAHMDDGGVRSQTISGIADIIRQHFDVAAPDFDMEVCNWRGDSPLKRAVMEKAHDLAQALNVKMRQGLPHVTPLHTIAVNRGCHTIARIELDAPRDDNRGRREPR